MRLFHRQGVESNIWKLMAFNFFWKFRAYYLIAIPYFSEITGSYTLGLSVLSIVYISGFCFEVITGYFSDRMGRKITLMAAGISSMIGLTILGLAETYSHLILGAIVEGLSYSFVSGTKKAMLFETLKQMKKEKSFHHYSGKVDTIIHAGLSVSTILSGFIAAQYGYQATFFITVGAAFLATCLSLTFQEPDVEHERSSLTLRDIKIAFSLLLKNRHLRYFTILNEWNSGFNECMFFYRTVFYKLFLPISVIGIMGAINHIFCGISYWFSGKIIDRFGPLKCLIGGFGFKAVVEAFVYAIQNIFSPILFFLCGLTYGLTTTTKQTLYQENFSNKQRSTMGSIVGLFWAVFYGFASLVVGLIADTYGIVLALYIALFLKTLPVFFYAKIFRMQTHHKMA